MEAVQMVQNPGTLVSGKIGASVTGQPGDATAMPIFEQMFAQATSVAGSAEQSSVEPGLQRLAVQTISLSDISALPLAGRIPVLSPTGDPAGAENTAEDAVEASATARIPLVSEIGFTVTQMPAPSQGKPEKTLERKDTAQGKNLEKKGKSTAVQLEGELKSVIAESGALIKREVLVESLDESGSDDISISLDEKKSEGLFAKNGTASLPVITPESIVSPMETVGDRAIIPGAVFSIPARSAFAGGVESAERGKGGPSPVLGGGTNLTGAAGETVADKQAATVKAYGEAGSARPLEVAASSEEVTVMAGGREVTATRPSARSAFAGGVEPAERGKGGPSPVLGGGTTLTEAAGKTEADKQAATVKAYGEAGSARPLEVAASSEEVTVMAGGREVTATRPSARSASAGGVEPAERGKGGPSPVLGRGTTLAGAAGKTEADKQAATVKAYGEAGSARPLEVAASSEDVTVMAGGREATATRPSARSVFAGGVESAERGKGGPSPVLGGGTTLTGTAGKTEADKQAATVKAYGEAGSARPLEVAASSEEVTVMAGGRETTSATTGAFSVHGKNSEEDSQKNVAPAIERISADGVAKKSRQGDIPVRENLEIKNTVKGEAVIRQVPSGVTVANPAQTVLMGTSPFRAEMASVKGRGREAEPKSVRETADGNQVVSEVFLSESDQEGTLKNISVSSGEGASQQNAGEGKENSQVFSPIFPSEKFETALRGRTEEIRPTSERTDLHESILSQVREKLAAPETGNGNGQITLKLNPRELGDLQIHLRMQDSKVSVEITAQNPVVREALGQNLDQLKEILQRQNIAMERFDVMNGNGQSSNQSFREGRQAAQPYFDDTYYPDAAYYPEEPGEKSIAFGEARQNSLVDMRF